MVTVYRFPPPFIFHILAHWSLRESAWDGAALFTGLWVRAFLFHALAAAMAAAADAAEFVLRRRIIVSGISSKHQGLAPLYFTLHTSGRPLGIGMKHWHWALGI